MDDDPGRACVALMLIRDHQVLAEKPEELRTLHYFAAVSWEGAIVPDEAESVVWIPLTALAALDFDVDKTAVNEYLRLEREGGLVWRTRA